MASIFTVLNLDLIHVIAPTLPSEYSWIPQSKVAVYHFLIKFLKSLGSLRIFTY